ncbi:nuclear pore complex protein Nup58 isoform X2 [Plodia interpunctella]|uniref:nuclear pore complex protein Nup58 isoform X2 n=1 Tax=Plodia interpunctella TaxID=58824 RepID=UPI002368D1C3|nr:nuclear pore complex protein Nup58 isoform X2 [Plodia interpunctella]
MSFSFGTPSSAPANTGLSGGFNFAAKPATPGFGLTATTQASTGLFGTPATSAPTFGSTGFGATTTPKFGATPALGTTPAFGTTPALGSTPAFGTTPALGTTPAFGTTPALGTTPAFGTTPALGTTPAFGTTPALGTNPGFGTTPALGTTPAFGTTPALGTTPAFGATSTAPAFGTGTPAFGTATSSAFGSTSLGTGLGGGGLNFGASSNITAPSTVTPSLGLGGVAPTTGVGTTNATDAKSEPPKQTKLPNEISTTVDSFKEFVKKQKSLSSEVMRVSIKPLHKVSREAESTHRLALSERGSATRARAQTRRLRAAAAAALAAADGLNNTGLELESPAPPVYVKELVSELEQQLISFRRQMDVADKQMQAEPKLLTEQELTLGIRRMHESLVALAGRLQTVHSQVEAQKEQYLNLRKYVLKDPSNVFDTKSYSTSLDQILKDAESSKKKTKTSNFNNSNDFSFGSAVLTDPRAALGNIQQLAGPTPFNYLTNTLSPFPTADCSGSGWQPTSQPQPTPTVSFPAAQETSFQLQKPPGKRGKQ